MLLLAEQSRRLQGIPPRLRRSPLVVPVLLQEQPDAHHGYDLHSSGTTSHRHRDRTVCGGVCSSKIFVSIRRIPGCSIFSATGDGHMRSRWVNVMHRQGQDVILELCIATNMNQSPRVPSDCPDYRQNQKHERFAQ